MQCCSNPLPPTNLSPLCWPSSKCTIKRVCAILKGLGQYIGALAYTASLMLCGRAQNVFAQNIISLCNSMQDVLVATTLAWMVLKGDWTDSWGTSLSQQLYITSRFSMRRPLNISCRAEMARKTFSSCLWASRDKLMDHCGQQNTGPDGSFWSGPAWLFLCSALTK